MSRAETFAEAVARLQAATDALRHTFEGVILDLARAAPAFLGLERAFERLFGRVELRLRPSSDTGDALQDRILRESEEEAEQVLQRLSRLSLLCDVAELRWEAMLDFVRQIRESGGRTWIEALDAAIQTIDELNPRADDEDPGGVLSGLGEAALEAIGRRREQEPVRVGSLQGVAGPFLAEESFADGRTNRLLIDSSAVADHLAEHYRRSGAGEWLRIVEVGDATGRRRRMLEVRGPQEREGDGLSALEIRDGLEVRPSGNYAFQEPDIRPGLYPVEGGSVRVTRTGDGRVEVSMMAPAAGGFAWEEPSAPGRWALRDLSGVYIGTLEVLEEGTSRVVWEELEATRRVPPGPPEGFGELLDAAHAARIADYTRARAGALAVASDPADPLSNCRCEPVPSLGTPMVEFQGPGDSAYRTLGTLEGPLGSPAEDQEPPPSDEIAGSLTELQDAYRSRREAREREGLPPVLDEPSPKLPRYEPTR